MFVSLAGRSFAESPCEQFDLLGVCARIPPAARPLQSIDYSDFCITIMSWPIEIASSAFRHRVSEEDIRHAFENSVSVYQIDREGPSLYLHLGPDRAGNLLELVAVALDSREWLVIHAMKMRPKFVAMVVGFND